MSIKKHYYIPTGCVKYVKIQHDVNMNPTP